VAFLLLLVASQSADPTCEAGILDAGKSNCCAKSCRKCGGGGCHGTCCSETIERSGHSCTSHDPPCIMANDSIPPSSTPPTQSPSQLALIGIVDVVGAGVNAAFGTVSKSAANPLFTKSKAWEKDINNGYPTVMYDPKDPLGTYRCWYDDHSSKALAYANSSDGLTWEKPELNVVDIGGTIGKRNNLVVRGNGIGVYKDPTAPPGSPARFKGFGALSGSTSKDGGTLTSSDGIHWGSEVRCECYMYARALRCYTLPYTHPTHPSPLYSCASFGLSPSQFCPPAPTPHPTSRRVPFPDPPQRYDTSNNLFWDPDLEQYVATTRRHPTVNKTDKDRGVGIVLSAKNNFSFDAKQTPPLISKSDHDHQAYAQVSSLSSKGQ
jgi:hypothetical protein